jgi:hypothetical protein
MTEPHFLKWIGDESEDIPREAVPRMAIDMFMSRVSGHGPAMVSKQWENCADAVCRTKGYRVYRVGMFSSSANTGPCLKGN